MPNIKCKGIASLIHPDPNASVEFDKDKRFYVIPKSLAKRYVKQRSIPLLLEHNDKLVVGKADSFYIADTEVEGELRQVLGVDFTITEEAFIDVVRNACVFRLKEVVPTQFHSSDGFIDDGDGGELDLTAHEALLQRLPSLSLGHDSNTLDIVEMSMCVAGARPATLMTSATYDIEATGNKATDEKVGLYTNFLSALHAISNGFRCRKVEKDIKALNMPTTCLVYSKTKGGEEGSITESSEQNDPAPAPITAKMENPPQHGVPNNFNESLRNIVESTFSRYLGVPQPQAPPAPVPVQHIHQRPTFAHWSEYDQEPPQRRHGSCSGSVRSKQQRRDNGFCDGGCGRHGYDDGDDNEDDYHKEPARKKRRNGGKASEDNQALQESLEEMKTQLKILTEHQQKTAPSAPVAASPIPAPAQQPQNPSYPLSHQDIGDIISERFKILQDSLGKSMQQQPEQQATKEIAKHENMEINDVPPSVAGKFNQPGHSNKPQNYSKTVERKPKTAQEHLRAKINDPSFVIGQKSSNPKDCSRMS